MWVRVFVCRLNYSYDRLIVRTNGQTLNLDESHHFYIVVRLEFYIIVISCTNIFDIFDIPSLV